MGTVVIADPNADTLNGHEKHEKSQKEIVAERG
jgi:hypothetical protein